VAIVVCLPNGYRPVVVFNRGWHNMYDHSIRRPVSECEGGVSQSGVVASE
jgi:hypothetical protein